MSPQERVKLVREYDRLRKLARDLDTQADSVDQLLAALTAKEPEMSGNPTIADAQMAVIMEAMIPTLREVVREELKAFRPLDEAWYEPSEVEAMSCGRVKADTLRKWLRFGQIDGESDGRQIRLYQSTVEELRKNKWRPLRQPDPSMLPASKRPKNLPSQSVAR